MTTLRAIRTATWLKRIAVVSTFSVTTASAVSAQTPPASERSLRATLSPGTTVWLTDSAGREEKTQIVGISGDRLTTSTDDGLRQIRTTEVRRVQVRQSDSLINGALIGAGAAVASGLFLCRATEPWDVCLSSDQIGPYLGFAAIGAGIGVGIDALIRGRKTIYETPSGETRVHAAPLVGRRGAGVQVSIGF